MAEPVQKGKVQFSQPAGQISLMLLVLAATAGGAFLALPSVMPIFIANPYLNGVIFAVFVIGVLACFYQVFQLIGSVRWIENFASDKPDPQTVAPPLLAPLASLLRQRGARMKVSATSTRSILDSVASRIDEAREITRYIVNMLIFLGLLGTFYGLATTVPAVVDTIRSLAPSEDGSGGGVGVFNRLMTGLEAQLGGMGVAFGSSLLGLAGSLVVGLLELFAGHGQNRFYQELEDWLSSITRVGFSSGEEGGTGDGAVAAVVDQMAEQMDSLQRVLAQSDDRRAAMEDKLGTLADAVAQMTQRMEASQIGQGPLDRIADGQDRMIAVLQQQQQGGGDGIDAESRMRLRSIDVQILRILEEISAGRQETLAELRQELQQLTRAVSGTADPLAEARRRLPGPQRPGGKER